MEEVPVRPVVFIRFFVDHYFVVVVDYEENLMFTFGKKDIPTQIWQVSIHTTKRIWSSGNTMVVATLAKAFSMGRFFNAPNQVISVNCHRWVPSFIIISLSLRKWFLFYFFTEGRDLCPLVCSLTKTLLSNGIEFDEEGSPGSPLLSVPITAGYAFSTKL